MPEVFEFGIIGMGPAGIGAAMSLRDACRVQNTICFERGSYPKEKDCPAYLQKECCYSDACTVISGIGGASTLSSGKLSDFPAGSGLADFFDSEQQLKEMLGETLSFISNRVDLKKVIIDENAKKQAQLYYAQRHIEYKYYDVYEFDGRSYRQFITETIEELRNKGLRILDNSEVIDVNRTRDTLYFQVKVKNHDGERIFLIRNLILATGALDIQNKLAEKMFRSIETLYEIGVRIEAPTKAFGTTLSTHGDLKLKLGSGRTYCVTTNGRIISYQSDGACFLEGCVEPTELTNYTNLAVLVKCNGDREIHDFIIRYRKEFRGLPIKQQLMDYMDKNASCNSIDTTLASAVWGDINSLLSTPVNNSIKFFIRNVLIDAMGIPKEKTVVVAPELKILRNLKIAGNFSLDRNLYVVGAATGKFRGILQSFCSGLRCGRLLTGGGQ